MQLSACSIINKIHTPYTSCTGGDKYVGGHHFKMDSLTAPRWCDVCGRFMWGLVRQGMKCKGRLYLIYMYMYTVP